MVASVNTGFGTTLAHRLNQSRVCLVLQTKPIAIKFTKFSSARAQSLNWESLCQGYSCNRGSAGLKLLNK